ncbi:hypothetical protein BGZ65_002242 [Modicella reniformis]|uniref:Uncharacterized protein n=1 Tax=Modicella reniformis TaxID=1440133 RepID=A0A9P6J1H5_9FUNG|nr:hypothetical protein BGZ65_002242 [Modicella reniformis]
MHDILMAYRLTGVTIFNANEMEDNDWSKYNIEKLHATPKEVGIRFETFANASYHEPYYVMIRRRVESQNDEDEDDQPNRDTLYISKHTIPHWIPLRDIEKRYLNRDLSTFTRLVSEHLQEVVGRRECSRPAAQDNPSFPPSEPAQID